MRKIIITAVVIIVLAAIVLFGVSNMRQRQQEQAMSNYLTETVARGNLTSLIGATGNVRSKQRAELIWQASGYAGQVNVKDGDEVTSGQVLVSLDEDELPANIISAQAELLMAKKQLEDLQNSNLTTAQAAQAVSDTQKTLIELLQVYDENFDTDSYQDDIDRANEDMLTAEEDLEDAIDDFEPYKDRDPDNTTRKSYEDKLETAQERYDETEREYRLLVLAKALAWQNIEVAQAQLADAEREYDRVKDGPNPDDITAQQARVDAAQATLDSVDLIAPFDGVITRVDVNSNDPVAPGQVAFQLNDLSQLLVDVYISEVDINNVQIGQNVRMTFDAIQGREYTGQVTEVSSIGLLNQGIVEFLVTIEVLDADEDVKPGMTAAVNIVVETLENVLLVPNRAVRSMQGDYIVYVIENNELVLVPIELGANSDTHSEVIDGKLRVNDQLVLNPPVTFDTNGPPPFARSR